VGQYAGVNESTEAALESVYRTQGSKMFRALVAFTGDREIAADAVGEAFAQAIARGGAIRDPVAWVWRVSFILARRDLKARGDSHITSQEGSYELAETMPEIFQALSRISPKQRLAVILHDYADRPTAEIADLLQVSRATVHVHLSKGRRRLRELLEVHDE
jgi:RNA polymerase sigma factor (sigma-70 family)